MKLSRLSILAVAALSCAAFAISCESDDANSLAPFWSDGDVDGGAGLKDGNGLNGGDGFGDLNGGDAGLQGGDGFGNGLNGGDGFDQNGPGAYGEDLNKTPYIDGFGARIEGVEFQPLYFPYFDVRSTSGRIVGVTHCGNVKIHFIGSPRGTSVCLEYTGKVFKLVTRVQRTM